MTDTEAQDRNGRARHAPFDQFVEIETPEQVVVTYEIAGVGSRAAAALIDYLITGLLSLAMVIPMCIVGNGAGRGGPSPSEGWVMAATILYLFAILWGYYVLYEGLADGQTPGKKRLGLRVVQDGGYSVSFAASAVRNLVRFIDLQPFFLYAVGITSVALSRSGKRVGDMVAGTIVVKERAVQIPAVPARPASATDLARTTPPVSALLDDREYTLLERYMARRQQLDPDRRRAIADQLAARLGARAPNDDAGSQAMLVRLYERERSVRAQGVASRSDTGAAREQHAIVALGAERWRAFASRVVATEQRGGLRALSESEVSDFVAHYREIATDLARLRTAARGREIDALFYLSRLVAAGHNLFYRQRRLVIVTVWQFMTATVPREIRRSSVPILAAASFLFVPAIIAYSVVLAHPETAGEFIPAQMIDRAENAVLRAKQGRGYIDDPELFRPVMGSTIIANNIQVTYIAFAMGITAGIGTIAALVFNGIHLGGFAGLYHAKGVGAQLLAFVAPHGVLELSAIAIAGGGGLLLASALLLPGALTRREALIVRGRRAIRLIAASTFLLFVAGTIEGLISPIEYWDLSLKLVVSAATALFLVVYITRGRHGEPDAPAEQSGYSEARALMSR
ncbi:MAG: stage II sporulation protein M [Gemmatimonadaceae bacterium]